MNYSDIEDDIVARLAPIAASNYMVIAMPNNNAANVKPQHRGAVVVQASMGEFKDQQSTSAASVMDEWVYIDLILRAKHLRGTGGIYDLSNLCKALLIGWTPPNAFRPMVGVDFSGINPAELRDGLWTYSLRLKVPYISSGTSDEDAAVLITQINVDDEEITNTPPTGEMYSSAYSVPNSGDQATLIWTTDNADSVEISGIGVVEPNGTHTVTITGDITYTLTVTQGATVITQDVEITLGASCDDAQLEVNGTNIGSVISGGTHNQLIQDVDGNPKGTSANPSIIANSTFQINGETVATPLAEDSVDIPVTLDGSPSGSWNGSEFELESAVGESREWVRNPEWLEMPTTTDGDNVIYILMAVRENVPNLLSMRATTSSGDYTVDLYNDASTVTNHASGSQADFDLDFANATDPVTNEGYSQVIVKVTGNLTAFDLYRRHPDVQVSHPICSGVLSVKITSQTITSLENVCRGQAATVFHGFLEEFEFFGTSNFTTVRNGFVETRRLGIVKGDFSNVVNAQNAWQYAGDFNHQELIVPSSGWGNLSQTFGSSYKRIFKGAVCANFFRGVEYPASTFNGSQLEIFGTPSDRMKFDSLSNTNGFYQTWQSCVRLNQAYFDQATTQPKSMYRAFRLDRSLHTVDGIDGSLVTNMTGAFDGCWNLSWLRIYGLTVSFSLEDCNFSREGLVQVFEDLGVASATITVSNNQGASELTAADLLIATDKGWTVIP